MSNYDKKTLLLALILIGAIMYLGYSAKLFKGHYPAQVICQDKRTAWLLNNDYTIQIRYDYNETFFKNTDSIPWDNFKQLIDPSSPITIKLEQNMVMIWYNFYWGDYWCEGGVIDA